MSKTDVVEALLLQAGVKLNDAARATLAEYLHRDVHVQFDGTHTDDVLQARVAEVIEKGDSATVRDLRNVLKYWRTKRGSGYGVVGIGVTYNPASPDEDAIITLVTGGRKTFYGVNVSSHYRMHGVQLALQALAKDHTVMRGNRGIPSAVVFGGDGAVLSEPAAEKPTPNGVEETKHE